MNAPEVTVFTPVYNGETYIKECVESVIAQTYKNWKFFIINNCSTDRTLEIIEAYPKLDSRICIINNREFLGAMENHNFGLSLLPPTSDYVKIVQGDDWIFSSCLEEMVGVGEAYPQVGIIGSYRLDGTRVTLDGLPYPSTCVYGKEICRLHLLEGYSVFGSPTSTMIRAEYVRNRDPFYDVSQIHCDKEVCFDILQHCDFGFVHQVLTFTRRRAEARTTKSVRLNSYLTANILMLKKYGPIFLSPNEQAKREQALLKQYYRYLGNQLIRFREKEFWEFHKDQQRQIGLNISWAEIGLRAALSSAAALVGPLYRKL